MTPKQLTNLYLKLTNVLLHDNRRREQLDDYLYVIDEIMDGISKGVNYEDAIKQCVSDSKVAKLMLTIKV